MLDKVYIGYARVSRPDQDLQRQLDALEASGCSKVFTDHGVSGTLASRPGLDACLAYLRPGDVLVIQELSRLGRSLKDLLLLIEDLQCRGIDLRVLNLGCDLASATGKLLVSVLGACAALERDLLVERTISGLQSARKRGRVGGRPRALTEDQETLVLEWHTEGRSQVEIARLLSTSPRTVARVLTRHSVTDADNVVAVEHTNASTEATSE